SSSCRCPRPGRATRGPGARFRYAKGTGTTNSGAPHALHAPELTRLDRVYEDIPLVFLQDDGVLVLANPDRVALNDDLGAVGTPWTKRDPLHRTSPPLASMLGQIAAWRPFAPQEPSMARTAASRCSRSAAFCSKSARMWAHGAAPERRSATMCLISASVRPSRRA